MLWGRFFFRPHNYRHIHSYPQKIMNPFSFKHPANILTHSFSAKCANTSTPYLKFLCKFSRIFFRVYKFRNGGVAGYVEYSGLVQSGKQTEIFAQGFSVRSTIVNDITNFCFRFLPKPYTGAFAGPKTKFLMSLTIETDPQPIHHDTARNTDPVQQSQDLNILLLIVIHPKQYQQPHARTSQQARDHRPGAQHAI